MAPKLISLCCAYVITKNHSTVEQIGQKHPSLAASFTEELFGYHSSSAQWMRHETCFHMFCPTQVHQAKPVDPDQCVWKTCIRNAGLNRRWTLNAVVTRRVRKHLQREGMGGHFGSRPETSPIPLSRDTASLQHFVIQIKCCSWLMYRWGWLAARCAWLPVISISQIPGQSSLSPAPLWRGAGTTKILLAAASRAHNLHIKFC